MQPRRPWISRRRLTEKGACSEHEQRDITQRANRMHLRLTRHKINTLLVLGAVSFYLSIDNQKRVQRHRQLQQVRQAGARVHLAVLREAEVGSFAGQPCANNECMCQ